MVGDDHFAEVYFHQIWMNFVQSAHFSRNSIIHRQFHPKRFHPNCFVRNGSPEISCKSDPLPPDPPPPDPSFPPRDPLPATKTGMVVHVVWWIGVTIIITIRIQHHTWMCSKYGIVFEWIFVSCWTLCEFDPICTHRPSCVCGQICGDNDPPRTSTPVLVRNAARWKRVVATDSHDWRQSDRWKIQFHPETVSPTLGPEGGAQIQKLFGCCETVFQFHFFKLSWLSVSFRNLFQLTVTGSTVLVSVRALQAVVGASTRT